MVPDPYDDSPEDEIDRPNGENSRSIDTQTDPSEDDGSSRFLLNAVFGAAVTAIATFFIPFAPLLGGALSGYLDAESTESGAKIGAVSGAIALVPLLIIAPLLLFVLFLDPVFAVGVLLVVGFVAVFLVAYTIGFSALGGVLGAYIKQEFGG